MGPPLNRSSVLLAALLLTLPVDPVVQADTTPVSLVADNVSFDQDTGQLTATGNVEVLYQGKVLSADTIRYDEAAEEVTASGNVTLTEPGGSVFLADSVVLSPDLGDGLINGAQLLISGRLQVASSELQRNDDRFTTLHNTVASSCVICETDPTPTWSIRAARITADELKQRIYFEDATFELLGVPVGYFPGISVPDPTVDRANGFLHPNYRDSDIYGTGIKLPYYFVLGDSADLTATPFVTTTGAALLEAEYRRRFVNGSIDLGGVLAVRDGMGGEFRGAVDLNGNFAHQQGFVSDFDINLASDDSFLQQFDYSDSDRLTSVAQVYRVRKDDYVRLSTIGFQSLRENEETGTVPFVLPEFQYNRNFRLDGIGGLFSADANALGIQRRMGLDMIRGGGGLDWRMDGVLGPGLLTSVTASGEVDIYQTWNDDTIDDGMKGRVVPMIAFDFRLPLLKSTAAAQHVIEPITQIIYSDALGSSNLPDEDSLLPEFDELNLFSTNRYPGRDRVETGLRANVGVKYNRYDPDGWHLGMTFGRVIRDEPETGFATGTGLAGRWSDFVGAVSLDFETGMRITNRALFNKQFDVRRNEFALGLESDKTDMEVGYTYLAEDDSNEALGFQPEINEFNFEASHRFHPNWEVSGEWRYDVATKENLRAGAGITYGNECAEFDLSVSRRYTSSANVPASTSISFSLNLAGLGDDGSNEWPSRACALPG